MDIQAFLEEIGQSQKWSWRRMPERERVNTRVSKALLGHPVQISRIVVRVGYWLHYHDMNEHAMMSKVSVRAFNLLLEAGLPEMKTYQMVSYMDRKRILKELQDQAIHALRTDPRTQEFARLHVAWYQELEQPVWFSPQSIVFKYNGAYSDLGYGPDADPPSLDTWLRQGYYQGQLEYGYSANTLVHPEDVLEQLRKDYKITSRS